MGCVYVMRYYLDPKRGLLYLLDTIGIQQRQHHEDELREERIPSEASGVKWVWSGSMQHRLCE